jgi:hypothetical protein
MLHRFQRSGLCGGDQSQGRIELAGLVSGLRRGQRPLRPPYRIDRQRGRPLQERPRRRVLVGGVEVFGDIRARDSASFWATSMVSVADRAVPFVATLRRISQAAHASGSVRVRSVFTSSSNVTS